MCVLKILITAPINRILQTKRSRYGRGKSLSLRFWLVQPHARVLRYDVLHINIGGNARWAAPEIYHITVDNAVPSATTQSDVYSLGCIMLQVRQLLFIRIASCNVSVLITCTLDFVCRVPYHYLRAKDRYYWNYRMAINLVGPTRGT